MFDDIIIHRYQRYEKYIYGCPIYSCEKAIGGLLGTAGGAAGTGFSEAQQADIKQGVTTDQVGGAYNRADQGLDKQEALLKALQGQGGIQNQTATINQSQDLYNQLQGLGGVANIGSVYNQGQNLANQLAQANGVGHQSQALSAQQALAAQQQVTANQYQNIANGAGPNPAQAALNNATGQNVANQAALMAGQRGAAANVGLIARQAAQQGAATQQQAVGQSAEMQAQQQLAGLQGLSAQQQAIGGTNQSVAGIAGQQLAAQQGQQQALAGLANQQVALQQGQQKSLAEQAANQVNQLGGATNAYNQGLQNEQGQLINGLNAQNNAAVNSQTSVNNAGAGLASKQMEGQQAVIGGIFNAAGGGSKAATGGGAAAAGAKGGEVVVPHLAFGAAPLVQEPPPGPTSSFGQFLHGWANNLVNTSGDSTPSQGFSGMGSQNSGAQELNKGISNFGASLRGTSKPKDSGTVLAGPDAKDMSTDTMMSAQGGLAQKGGHVAAKSPGQKAVKSGNSYDNDKVPAMLSEGEVVIPRSIMQSQDPARGAADFVAKVLAKRRVR